MIAKYHTRVILRGTNMWEGVKDLFMFFCRVVIFLTVLWFSIILLIMLLNSGIILEGIKLFCGAVNL